MDSNKNQSHPVVLRLDIGSSLPSKKDAYNSSETCSHGDENNSDTTTRTNMALKTWFWMLFSRFSKSLELFPSSADGSTSGFGLLKNGLSDSSANG